MKYFYFTLFRIKIMIFIYIFITANWFKNDIALGECYLS